MLAVVRIKPKYQAKVAHPDKAGGQSVSVSMTNKQPKATDQIYYMTNSYVRHIQATLSHHSQTVLPGGFNKASLSNTRLSSFQLFQRGSRTWLHKLETQLQLGEVRGLSNMHYLLIEPHC